MANRTGTMRSAPVDDSSDNGSSSDSMSSDDEIFEEEPSRSKKIANTGRPVASAGGDGEDERPSEGESSIEDDEDLEFNRREEESESEVHSSSSSSTSVGRDGDASEDEIQSTIPLGQRLHMSAQTNEGARQAATQTARQRKKEAKELASKRLAALRASKIEQPPSNAQPKKKKKVSKHRPTEASSKRADFYNNRTSLNESGIGVQLGAHRYKPKDPRGSNLVGHFNEEHFSRNYSFLRELQQKEMSQLKKRIAARRTSGKKGQKKRRALGITGEGSLEDDKARLKQLQQQFADEERHRIDVAAQHTVKKRLREKSAAVGKPVYFKRQELKRMTYEAKLEEVRKRRGDKAVEKVVTKRRKRIKSRDAKRLAGGRDLP